VEGGSILPSQRNGNASPAERAASSFGERWRTRANSLVSVGSFPQLVRGHSGREVVVLHDILEVELRHHVKLKKKREESEFKKVQYYVDK